MKRSSAVALVSSLVVLVLGRGSRSQSQSTHAPTIVRPSAIDASLFIDATVALRSDGARERAAGEGPVSSHRAARSTTDCPEDMVLVRGTHCNEVDEPCVRWADNDRGQCLQFAERSRCTGQRMAVSVCMDRYEWPNQRGALPSVMVTFDTAEALCAARGRRLCTEDEWAFACSGEELLPYPYGRERSADACTIDLYARAPNKPLLHSSNNTIRAAEVERIYMASPSGTRPSCRSPFGLYDLTGNVDEWVRSTRSFGQYSALMGGFWGHVRNRCRAVTRAHGPRFSYYQIGFRCCSDATGAPRSSAR
ncbi:MAG: SUMF1/EgtB/PvdO family nonheme iron enzyme [Polyangiales bacterium]